MAVLEIRTYRLDTGRVDDFHRLFVEDARPLLSEFGIDVVRMSASECGEDDVHDYVLMRAFASTAQRDELETRFYGSAAWRDGPRAEVLAAIDNFHTVVLTVEDAVIDGLRDGSRDPVDTWGHAIRAAEQLLRRIPPLPQPVTTIGDPELHDWCWIVYWTTSAIASGQATEAPPPGTGPILVDRFDGTAQYLGSQLLDDEIARAAAHRNVAVDTK